MGIGVACREAVREFFDSAAEKTRHESGDGNELECIASRSTRYLLNRQVIIGVSLGTGLTCWPINALRIE